MLRSRPRSLILSLALLVLAGGLSAQTPAGRIAGRVADASSGRPLAGARVTVVGTTHAASTNVEGRYLLANVPAGARSVAVSFAGYATKTVTGVSVTAGATATLDVALSIQAAQPARTPSATPTTLAGITVTAERERGSTTRALDEQRTAINVSSGISREEIARGPDDDAAEAVQRVSGVTVEGGRYVFVRGLGERYTTTQLNGARLPSPEPDRRVVPLDLFPAGTLESILVSKTFTPDQEGDFAGAQVNLRTRVFDNDAFTQYSFTLGFNSEATFRELALPGLSASEYFGFASGDRQLPGELRGGLGALNTNQGQSAVLRTFRQSWRPDHRQALPNLSLSYSRGAAADVLGREVSYLGAVSYQNRFAGVPGEQRAIAVLEGQRTRAENQYEVASGRQSVSLGGVFNLGLDLDDLGRIEFNNTYDRTADNEALRLRGRHEELATELDINRLQYVERSILSSQLRGEHFFGSRHGIDWRTTFSRTTRDEPDRSEVVYARERDFRTGQDVFRFFGSGTAPTSRFFSDLQEWSGTAQADYTLRFGASEAGRLKVGGLFRHTDRAVTASSFDFENVGLGPQERELPVEQLFNGQFFDAGNLGIRIRPNIFGGNYTADENLASGYAMLDYPLTERLSAVAGLRVESADLEVIAEDVFGLPTPAGLNDLDLLPALALNFRLTDTRNLRLSATQTLSRPEYRELANVTARDYVGGYLRFGNPDLRRALIQNYDARFETYPAAGEVASVAVFAKTFQDPIEQVFVVRTGSPALSFRNANRATNYGMELELRRRLSFITEALDPVIATANLTLVRSEVDFSGTEGAEGATSERRPLLGQAPYVINLGLTYDAENDASATVLFNSVGRRLTTVGLGGIPDAYERARSQLDASFELPVLRNGVALRVEAENLLNSVYEVSQGEVTLNRYRTGRSASVGLSFRPGAR